MRQPRVAFSTFRHEKTVINDYVTWLERNPSLVGINNINNYISANMGKKKASTRNKALQTITQFVNFYALHRVKPVYELATKEEPV